MCIVAQFGTTTGSPTLAITDHPSAGPTGIQACGTCFPSTRAVHSYIWGTPTAPLCPGEVPADAVCHAEWLFEAAFANSDATGPSSWGHLKALYR